MTCYRQIKGDTYEDFIFYNISSEYDSVYYFKDVPENIISKTNLYNNYEIYYKYKNCDIGADLVAVKNDNIYFIQCKNFSNTISIND
jgi:predicted helicase